MTWDKIAKTGTYTDMHGKNYTFTAADFAEIAANYAKTQEKAPLVVGHPSTDAPAFGWVASLRTDGDYLYAEYEKVSNDIKEAVNNGQYRHKSISLFPDLKRLKHVGLLGAVPPAMSGLGTISFSDSEGVTLSFSENYCGGNRSPVPPPSSPFPRAELTPQKCDSAAFVTETINESVILSFAENINIGAKQMTLEEALQKIAELQTQLSAIQGELERTAAEKKTAKEESEATEAKFAAFQKEVELKARETRINGLIAQGKLEPARKDEVMKIAEKLSVGAPAFASGSSSESIEDSYLRSFESKEASPLLAEFAVPEQGKPEQYSTKDITDKL